MQEKDKPKKQGKTNKSIRFPRAVAEEVTEYLQETGGTFSAFVIDAVRAALEDLQRTGTRVNDCRK